MPPLCYECIQYPCPHLPFNPITTPPHQVTLDLHRMLTAQPRSNEAGREAAAWACAYLSLAPKYSPAGAVRLWAWLRQGGALGMLLGCASQAGERR